MGPLALSLHRAPALALISDAIGQVPSAQAPSQRKKIQMTAKPLPRIVVGIDGSTAGLGALHWALLKGQELDGVVEVVHCWHPHMLTDIMFGSVHELRTGSECMVQNEVAAALAATGAVTDVVQTSIHGRPAPTLLKQAKNASMLVLGTHGRTGISDLMLGPTATRCQHGAKCPVVIVDVDGQEVVAGARRWERAAR